MRYFDLPSAGAAVLVAIVLSLGWPRPAEACGGVFCSQLSTPVEQNSERILFVVNSDDTITAHVEISYAGSPSGFSWVVPVPDTPTVEVVPPSTLRMLDLATVPTVVPQPLQCSDPLSGVDVSFALYSAEALSVVGTGGVTVEELPTVGPFSPEVVSSTNPQILIDWLRTNGYVVSVEMEPYIADYVAKGFKFLGMKLTAGASVSDISPIKMTYPGTAPCIPLVLTSVAAEPEMGVLVFIAAGERYGALNYENLDPPVDKIRFGLGQTTNYYSLASYLIDQEGGNAFITEFAGSSATAVSNAANLQFTAPDGAEAVAYLEEVLRGRYLTRMYTRISAWEMLEDPIFEPTAGLDIVNVHDLSDRPPLEFCGPEWRLPCADLYCGPGATCATTRDGQDGCVCPPGSTARVITAPHTSQGTIPSVTCQPIGFDLLASLGSTDACDAFACGDNGSCRTVAGFKTCECDAGYAAILVPGFADPRLKCARVKREYAPERLVYERNNWACSTGTGPDGFGLLALLLLVCIRSRRR